MFFAKMYFIHNKIKEVEALVVNLHAEPAECGYKNVKRNLPRRPAAGNWY